jgi:hypothetical protein
MGDDESSGRRFHTDSSSESSRCPYCGPGQGHASVAKRVFNSVETQTMFTWIENTEKPTRLTGKPKEKNVKTSHKTSRVNHPEEDSIQIPPPNHQVVHVYCGPGQGP